MVIVWIGRVLGGLIGLIILLVVAGIVYQAIGNARDRDKYPPPGKLVDVGGYRLHINCLGEGEPTVVMDAMGGGWSTHWGLVTPEIAKFARVCVFDRAGLGWSDSGPTPRTARQVAVELNTLLHKTGITGPYVLVGHSFGGFTVRLYHHQYPSEVAGMVLVDAGHEGELDSPEYRVHSDWVLPQLPLRRIFVILGISRLMVALDAIPESENEILEKLSRLSPDDQTIVLALGNRSDFWKTMIDVNAALEETCTQVRATGSLGDLPLVVLTATGPKWWPGWPPDFPVEPLREKWMEMQKELLKLSSNSTHMLAEKSSHFIQLDQPELIVKAVRQVVEAVRRQKREVSQ
jgi:pimeloyl-ACP methyl ester carboxylesterase